MPIVGGLDTARWMGIMGGTMREGVKMVLSTAEPKNKGGRPKKQINYELLSKLCKMQCTGDECASVLDMSYESLNNKLKAECHGGFLDYYKRFASEGKASLRRMQWKTAESGSHVMQIWLGKQYLGQREPDRIEHNNPESTADSVRAFGEILRNFAHSQKSTE